MTISIIQLDADVVSQFERFQAILPKDLSVQITQAANQAVRAILNQVLDQKLEQEQEAFSKQHSSLAKTHLGKYVAFHQGVMIDNDANQRSLAMRVYQKFPNTPIGLFLVKETAEVKTHRHFDLRRERKGKVNENSL